MARDVVEVDGLRVGYERFGAGPPLVLLHGYVGDGASTWRPQLDELSDDFTVIAWDAPGVGVSSDPPESFGTAGYADCLAGFLRALGIAAANIVGLSFGGILAIALAARHPSAVAKLVLVSAYAGWRGSLPSELADQRLAQALALADLPSDELVAALLPTMFTSTASPAVVDAFGRSMAAFHPTGFRAMSHASAEDLRELLPHVAAPTLLVYGEDDVRAPAFVADHLRGAIAGSTLVVLPGAGHVCNIDASGAFNEAVRSFLRDGLR